MSCLQAFWLQVHPNASFAFVQPCIILGCSCNDANRSSPYLVLLCCWEYLRYSSFAANAGLQCVPLSAGVSLLGSCHIDHRHSGCRVLLIQQSCLTAESAVQHFQQYLWNVTSSALSCLAQHSWLAISTGCHTVRNFGVGSHCHDHYRGWTLTSYRVLPSNSPNLVSQCVYPSSTHAAITADVHTCPYRRGGGISAKYSRCRLGTSGV